MAETGIKICKYCGKEYPACKTVFKPGVFRWRDVACCEEHAAKYLEQVLAARNKTEESHDSNNSAALVEHTFSGGDENNNATMSDDTIATKTYSSKKKKRRKSYDAEDPVSEEFSVEEFAF